MKFQLIHADRARELLVREGDMIKHIHEAIVAAVHDQKRTVDFVTTAYAESQVTAAHDILVEHGYRVLQCVSTVGKRDSFLAIRW